MENFVGKYVVVCAFARFDGGGFGSLTTDSSIVGSFSSIETAIEKMKEDIDATIEDETNGIDDEELRKEAIERYGAAIDEEPMSIQKDLDGKGWSEIGTLDYCDGYNYIAAKYTMYLNK